MSINIEKLTEENRPLLANVAEEVFDNAIEYQYLDAFISDPRHVMFIAIEKETVIGMASAVEYFHPDKPAQLWINEVGVGSKYRRRGIGRKLVEALLQFAEERGCVYAWLGTDKENTPAQSCFSSIPEVEKPQEFLLYEWELD